MVLFIIFMLIIGIAASNPAEAIATKDTVTVETETSETEHITKRETFYAITIEDAVLYGNTEGDISEYIAPKGALLKVTEAANGYYHCKFNGENVFVIHGDIIRTEEVKYPEKMVVRGRATFNADPVARIGTFYLVDFDGDWYKGYYKSEDGTYILGYIPLEN